MDITRRRLLLGSSCILASNFILPKAEASTLLSPQKKDDWHVYTLAEYDEAAALVKNGKYVPATIGCAYKLIMTTQNIYYNRFIQFLAFIPHYMKMSEWNPTHDHHVDIFDPITGEYFFIWRTESTKQYEIAKNASLNIMKLFSWCIDTLEDYPIDECNYILIRGIEKLFDVDLNTDWLEISRYTSAGIDFRI